MSPSEADTSPSHGSPVAFSPPKQLMLKGNYVTLTTLTPEHIDDLWKHMDPPNNPSIYQYLPVDPPASAVDMYAEFSDLRANRGFVIYAILADRGKLSKASGNHTTALGVIAFLDISTAHRSLEVGAVIFSPILQRTAAATEIHYLMLRLAFEGVISETLDRLPSPAYRRVAWKCNSLNVASRRAADRLGFKYEGTIRYHMIVKGESRDSEFLSILDHEWPSVKAGLEAWLADENFDEQGRQRRKLEDCRRQASGK